MSLTDIKKELSKFDKDKLIRLITELYKSNKSVKEYLDFFVNPNEEALYEKARAKVYEAFFPKRGYRHKLSDGKKAISDFKKLGGSKELLADLMFYYVETGVEMTENFGDIDEPFYSSLESVYEQALKLMQKEKLLDKFKVRANKIVTDTRYFGWGFYDWLSSAYSEFYEVKN